MQSASLGASVGGQSTLEMLARKILRRTKTDCKSYLRLNPRVFLIPFVLKWAPSCSCEMVFTLVGLEK
jgi:hypothetical protein